MQSLTSWGYFSPPDVNKLERIKEYYEIQVKAKGEKLTPILARKLVALLLSLTDDSDPRTSSLLSGHQPTDNARKALELFDYFLENDEVFFDAVERLETYELLAHLKFANHIRARHFKMISLTSDVIARHHKLTLSLIRKMIDRLPKLAKNLQHFVDESGDAAAAPVSSLSQRSLFKYTQSGRLPPAGMYYDTDSKLLVKLFQSNLERGIDDAEASKRRESYGANLLPTAPPPSPLKMLLKQFLDFMIAILIVVAIVSLALQDWIEAVVLLLVVFTNVIIGFWQEYKAELECLAIQALQSLEKPMAKVRRSGEQVTVEAAELVPGDIVVLEEGDAVPADLRLVDVSDLHVVEALLTGESEPVAKSSAALLQRKLGVGERRNMAFMNTAVAKGRAVGIVVATGSATEVGKISDALVRPSDSTTLLQRRLSRLGKILVVISVVLCLVIVAIGLLRTYFAGGAVTSEEALKWIKVGVALAVSVIPEGLVAVTTITMSLGVQRMAKSHAIVRKLAAVETLGALTTICSDKTGTLTEGRMTATLFWAPQRAEAHRDERDTIDLRSTRLDDDDDERSSTAFRIAMMTNVLCNHATLADGESAVGAKGDPTEIALLVAAERSSFGEHYWRSEREFSVLGEAPFDSDRKRMSVVVSEGVDAKLTLLAKGAVETIVGRCSRVLLGRRVLRLRTSMIRRIDERNSALAGRGLRVLALAYRRLDASRLQAARVEAARRRDEADADVDVDDDVNDRKNAVERTNDDNNNDMTGAVQALEDGGLVFVGLIGLIDPPRSTARDTVSQCHDAGIRVCMITGDHQKTAFAIATQLGICKSSDANLILNGQQLDAMTIDDLVAMNHFPLVFARVSPANKLMIVDALRARGELCAMTGDGVNDAPAIKHSNVGIAMGATATDMTKQAAAVILTDDNFATIAKAVHEGRRIYDNIVKFVMYLLACNSAELYSMLFAVIIGMPVPMSPIMILWANLIADVPPAIALGVDPAMSDAMSRPPRDPARGIFSRSTLLKLVVYGVSMASITLALLAITIYVVGEDVPDNPETKSHGRALAFVALTSMQLFHAFVAHASSHRLLSREIFSNRYLLGAFLASMFLLVVACYIPGVNDVLQQYPLSWFDWGCIALCVVAHLTIAEIFRFILRSFNVDS